MFAVDAVDARLQPTGPPTRSATRSGTTILASYEEKEKLVGREVLQRVERDIMLQIVDAQWKDHLYSLDHLKEGIGLRGYGQRDPLVEYKKESFELFQAMKERVDEEIVRYLWWLRPILERRGGAPAPAPRRPAPRRAPLILNDPGDESARRRSFGAPRSPAPTPRRRPRSTRRAAAAARRRRRRAGEDGPARRAEGRPQRSVPVRQRQEIQEVPRRGCVTLMATNVQADDASTFVHQGYD